MRFKSARDLDAFFDKRFDIVNVPVFSTHCQVPNCGFERGPWRDQFVGKLEHALEWSIANGQSQVRVIDRQTLCDQVQTRGRQAVCVASHSPWLPSPRATINVSEVAVTIRKICENLKK